MQIRIIGASFALGIPKTGFGVNASTFAYIQLRTGPNTKEKTLAVDKHFSLGGSSGTFIWSNVKTQWSNIDVSKYPWICNIIGLSGKIIDISVTGTLLGSGTTDIEIKVIGEDGENESLVSKMSVQSEGFQLSGLNVRGKLKLIQDVELKECAA